MIQAPQGGRAGRVFVVGRQADFILKATGQTSRELWSDSHFRKIFWMDREKVFEQASKFGDRRN